MSEKFREAASKMKQAVSGQYAARDKACRAYLDKAQVNGSLDGLLVQAFNAGWGARKAAQYESPLDKPSKTCDRRVEQEWIADAMRQGK